VMICSCKNTEEGDFVTLLFIVVLIIVVVVNFSLETLQKNRIMIDSLRPPVRLFLIGIDLINFD
jgi:hypothetical protein